MFHLMFVHYTFMAPRMLEEEQKVCSPLDGPGKKKIRCTPPRYQGCYISYCREFYAEFNAKCCQSGNLCRKFVNMIL